YKGSNEGIVPGCRWWELAASWRDTTQYHVLTSNLAESHWRYVLDSAYHIPHTYAMRITISLPDHLASRFFALVSSRERSATIARLLEQELALREHALEQACLAANADAILGAEMDEWQAFEDDIEEPPAS